MRLPLRLSAPVLAVTLLPAQDDAAPSAGRVAVAGGTVSVHHEPVAMRAASIEAIQQRNTVWSIGAKEAAVLETDVALAHDKTLVPPGRYRLSTWFKRRGEWSLLVFSRGTNYKSGTPFFDLPLRLDEPDQPAPLTRLTLRDADGILRLELFAGTSRLRVSLRPLPVTRQDGTLAGRPATYEFYSWPAIDDVHQRLRNMEPLLFGRILDKASFGTVFQLTCRNAGKGVFVDARSSTLRDNRELLREVVLQRKDAAGDRALAERQAALEQAIAAQRNLQTNIVIPASVYLEQERAPQLTVAFAEKAGEPRTFELRFGIRRMTFSLADAQLQQLSWK